MFHFLYRDVEAAASTLTSSSLRGLSPVPPGAQPAGRVTPPPARVHLGSFDGEGLIRARRDEATMTRDISAFVAVSMLIVVATVVLGSL